MDIFEKIVSANTAPGEESEVREIIQNFLSPYADEIYTDKTGNLVAVFDGGKDESGKTEDVAVFASMDVPGLIVTYIEDNGHIKVSPIGNCDYRSVCCSVVTNGKISGVLMPESESSDKVTMSYVDFGFENAQEAGAHISLGDTLFFNTTVTALENGFISGAGLAVKACTSAVCLAAKETLCKAGKRIYFVFCCKSSLDSIGAAQTAYQINPDKALCVAPYSGKDFAVKILDGKTMCDQKLTAIAEGAITAKGYTAKRYVGEKDEGDASRVFTSGQGVKTASILMPSKYRGSLAETVQTNNISALSGIITEFLNNI